MSEPCFRVHGRATVSNGVGPWMWIVGTKRHVGLFFDEKKFLTLDRYLEFGSMVYGDFEIGPLQKDRPGEMREICLRAMANLVVEKFGTDGSRRVFRVKRCPECSRIGEHN